MRPPLQLKPFDLTMIIVSLVIGLGIFRTPHDVALATGPSWHFFLAWGVGGTIALFGALSFAEIGSRYPVTGGFYRLYAYCYHPAPAFMINSILLVSNAASVSAVALIGIGYLQGLLPEFYQGDAAKRGMALAAVVAFFVLNYAGFRMSVRTQNLLSLLKLGIVLFICLGAFWPVEAPPAPVQAEAAGFWEHVRGFGVALVAISFTYGGYQQVINFGGETHQPQRSMPRAIFAALALIIALYLLVNYAYVRVLGFEGLLAGKDNLAARHVGLLFGPGAYQAMSLLLFMGVLAYVNIGLLSNPRVMFAMAEDGLLPAVLKKHNPQNQVHTVALLTFTALSAITLVFAKTFEELLNYVIFLDCIGLAVAVGSIFILRRKTRHLDETGIFRLKWYPLMPVVYIAANLFVSFSIFMNQPGAALGGLVLFAAMGLVYMVFRAKIPDHRNTP